MKLQQELLETVVDVVDALVFVLDEQSRIVQTNRASESRLGFRSHELAGRSFVDTFLPAEQVEPFQRFFDALRGGVADCQLEALVRTKDGDQRLIYWTAEEIHCGGMQHASRQFILSGSDRTEQAQLQQERDALRMEIQDLTGALCEADRRVVAGRPLGALLSDPVDGTGPPDDGFSPPEPPGGEPAATDGPHPGHAAGQERAGRERRRSPRRAYPYRQLVAPMYADKLPSRKSFFEVVCQDISASGIAFLLDHKPAFERVVVALGRPPRLSFFIADIVRLQPQGTDGRGKWLAGCRFHRRIEG